MPPITAQDKIVPHMSDPATLAATRSIALDNSPHPGLEDLELATETSTVPSEFILRKLADGEIAGCIRYSDFFR